MGMSVPLAVRLVTRSAREVGRQVGNVYAANTLGTVLGAFLVGFAMIPLVGVRTSFICIAALNVLIGLGLLMNAPGLGRILRLVGVASCFLFIVGSQLAVPHDIILSDYAKTLGKIIFFDESVTDTVMVVDMYNQQHQPDEDYRLLVYADGRGTAGHPSRHMNRFTGHLPMLLNKDPKDVLVICIGSGNTMGAIKDHERMQRMDCVDISKGVVKATRYFESNRDVLRPPVDPRINVYIDDGRNYLLGTDKKYDVIHLEPPELHTAGVVFLFTEEFYSILKKRLKPGGVMLNWISQRLTSEDELKSLIATFQKVFPHGTIWQDPLMHSILFVGGNAPLQIPLKNMYDILEREPTLRTEMAEDHMDDPLRLISLLLMDEGAMADYCQGAPLVTDDMTRIDFSNPRSITSGFGFIHLFSTVSWDNFHIRGNSDWRVLAANGWTVMRRLTRQTSDVTRLIDWSGFTPGQKEETLHKLQALLQERQRFAQSEDYPSPTFFKFLVQEPAALNQE